MAQQKDDIEKTAELNTLFLALDNRGQESALTVLRALQFAQSVMRASKPEDPPSDSFKSNT